jgi:hypothetical protein
VGCSQTEAYKKTPPSKRYIVAISGVPGSGEWSFVNERKAKSFLFGPEGKRRGRGGFGLQLK